MDRIRVGIVGAGLLGRRHAEACAANPLAQVVGVADVRPEAAQAAAQAVGAQPFASAQALFEAAKLDLAIIATPDASHREPFLAAVRAGVGAILCEKPLATRVADAEAMLAAAGRARTRVFVNFSNRFAGLFRASYRTVRDGAIGRPVYAESNLDDNISVPRSLWGERSRKWASESSTAYFLLPHIVDLYHWLFAPARVLFVQAMKQDMALGYCPDLYDAHLFWDNGLKTRAKAAWIKQMETLVQFHLAVDGAQGGIEARRLAGYGAAPGWRALLDPGWSETRAQALAEALRGDGLDVRQEWIADPTQSGDGRRGRLELGSPGDKADCDLFLAAVAEATDEPSGWRGYGPLPSGQDGLEAARVVHAIVESAETGQSIRLRRPH